MKKLCVLSLIVLMTACANPKQQPFEEQFSQHREKIEQSCDNPQDRKGCQILGEAHYKGWGVAKDYAKAAFYSQQACEAGFADSCFNLGLLYQKGKGVPRDYKKAVELYSKACNGNNAQACNNLGVLYNKGFGVAPNAAKARYYFHKSCQIDRNKVKNNNASYGCYNLK